MFLLAMVVVIVCINFIETFASPVFKLELINETDLKFKNQARFGQIHPRHNVKVRVPSAN